MSLKKYEAFVRTVELGSLTKAAQSLGSTQSRISHILNDLEEGYGFRLMRRSMVDAILSGEEVPVNDTETYDNGVKVVPSYLCEPVFADASNYQELLIDSGYYTAEQLAG